MNFLDGRKIKRLQEAPRWIDAYTVPGQFVAVRYPPDPVASASTSGTQGGALSSLLHFKKMHAGVHAVERQGFDTPLFLPSACVQRLPMQMMTSLQRARFLQYLRHPTTRALTLPTWTRP